MLINDKHFRPHLSSYYSFTDANLRNLNLKYLKQLDSNLSRNYAEYKMMGGSIKSFFQKVNNFGKKVLSAMPRVSKVLHNVTGKVLNALNTPTGKAIVDKIGDMVNGVAPGVGTIIKRIPEVAKKGYDGLTDIINKIHEHAPQVSIEQATNLVKDIYNTSKNIYTDYKDEKQKADEKKKEDEKNKEELNKKALEETKDIAEKLTDVIKEEKGEVSAGLMKSAKYLPIMRLVNPVYTKKSKEGGMIDLPIPRYTKPSTLIKRYLGEEANKNYPTAAVNKYAGRLFLAGKCSGRLYLAGKDEKEPTTRKTGLKGKSLLDKLRNDEL